MSARIATGAAALLLPALSLGLPVLEAREPATRTHIEAPGHTGACGYRHDHAACVQFSHSPPIAPAVRLESWQARVREDRAAPSEERPSPVRFHPVRLPRSPPRVTP
ncbi:MAG: hypothetical protein ACE5HF_01265 [Gemmatimonadota bacterium]